MRCATAARRETWCLIRCEKSGRRARLIELDPKYVDVIVKRWEEFTGRKAIRVGEPIPEGEAVADPDQPSLAT